jgi:PKD repeat protein
VADREWKLIGQSNLKNMKRNISSLSTRNGAILVVSVILVVALSAAMITSAAGSAELSATRNTTAPDGQATVTFELTNTGSEAGGYILALSLPDGFGVAETSDAGGTWNAEESKWLYQTIDAGASKSPSVTLSVPADATGDYAIEGTVKTADGVASNATAVIAVESDNEAPEAAFTANRSTATVGEPVLLDAGGSTDDGELVEYRWDLDGDEQPEETTSEPTLVHTFSDAGEATPSVTVVDDDNTTATAGTTLTIENDSSQPGDGEPLTISTSPVAPGNTTTVGFGLTNTGSDASGYILDVSLPTNLSVTGQSGDGGTWNPGETKWLYQTIESGNTKAPLLTVSVPPDTPSEYVIEATVKTADGTLTNETETIQVETDTPDKNESSVLSIRPTSAQAGGTATVELNVTNPGTDPQGYILDLSLPTELAVDTQTADGGTWNAGETKLLYQTIDPGESRSPMVTISIPSDAAGSYPVQAELKTADGVVSDVSGNLTIESESRFAAFGETTGINRSRATPESLADKLRVESDVASETLVELRRNTTTTYSVALTAPDDATNVTFYLQTQAISASQDVDGLTMYLDGEEHPFVVNESIGPGNSPWVAFNVPHFSTRTVTFSTDNATLSLKSGSMAPRRVNESVTGSHDVSAVFENVSRDGNTDAFAITFPDAVAGGNLSANSATVTDPGTDEEISITSSLSKVDGPDQDGIRDTLRFAVSPDGGGTVDVAANVSVDVTWPGVDANTTYTVQASAEDSATGNVSLTPVANAAVLNIVVGPEPSITVSPETPETGTSVTFDASGSTDPDGSITSYEWDLTGDGSVDETGETVSYTYSSSGDYDVSLTVRDDDGATNTTTTTVPVTEPNESPQASFTVSFMTPEVGTTVTFDASSSTDPDGTITSYEWDLTGDGSIDETGESVSYTYTTTGEYDATLTVTDDDGATNTTTATVTVREPNTDPEASFTVSPGSPEVGSTVTFDGSASMDPDGTITSYEWDLFDNGSTDRTGSTASVAYSEAGEYTVSLVVTDDDGATAETTQVVTVNAPPTAQMSVTPTDPEVGQEVTFTATASTDPDGSIETYQWDLTGDGNVDATGAEVTRTYQSSGGVQITLTVIDDDGLQTQHQIELTVQPSQTTTPGDTETTAPGDTETTVPRDTETTAPGDTETTAPRDTETTAPGDTETTAPGDTETTVPEDTETTVPEDTETDETTSPETSTDANQGTDKTGTPSQETPGFGIGATIAGFGGAGYLLKRRLEFEDEEQ